MWHQVRIEFKRRFIWSEVTGTNVEMILYNKRDMWREVISVKELIKRFTSQNRHISICDCLIVEAVQRKPDMVTFDSVAGGTLLTLKHRIRSNHIQTRWLVTKMRPEELSPVILMPLIESVREIWKKNDRLKKEIASTDSQITDYGKQVDSIRRCIGVLQP